MKIKAKHEESVSSIHAEGFYGGMILYCDMHAIQFCIYSTSECTNSDLFSYRFSKNPKKCSVLLPKEKNNATNG